MIIASVCNRNRRLALHERFPCVNPPSNWKIVRLARALGRQSDLINTVLLGQANALGTHVHYSRCDYACSPFGNFTFRIVILVFFLFLFADDWLPVSEINLNPGIKSIPAGINPEIRFHVDLNL